MEAIRITSDYWCGGYRDDGMRCLHHDKLFAAKCPAANFPHRQLVETMPPARSSATSHADAKPRATHWCGGYRPDQEHGLDLCMHVTTMQAGDCPRRAVPITLPVSNKRIKIAPGDDVKSDPIAALVAERGAVYGPPAKDFARMAKLAEIVAECPDPIARHCLYMIAVKMSRLITSPRHADSWVDIQGYGRCGADVMTEAKP